MEDLARTQESLGRVDDAILTLARLSNALLHTRDDGVDDSLSQLTRLIQKSAAAQQLSGSDTLVTLTPPPLPAPKKTRQTLVNPDSPFKRTPTNLGDFKLGPIAIRELAPLPDGRWIAALTAGPRVFTALSRDLVTWDAPQPLPFNAIANNIDPALIVDDAGVIWLAWFSNRLSLNPRSSAGYTLWLTHSSDAKNWSPPRAVSADTGGWPMGAMHWSRSADHHFRLSWRSAAAIAASPAEITKLDPIEMTCPERMWPMDPHVTRDDADHFHLVLNDVMRGISYAKSDDGVKWSDPIVLVNKLPNSGFSEPELLIDGLRVALLYRDYNGTYLRRGRLADLPALSLAVQISTGGGTRWQRIGEQIVGTTDGESPFLLRVNVKDVFAVP